MRKREPRKSDPKPVLPRDVEPRDLTNVRGGTWTDGGITAGDDWEART